MKASHPLHVGLVATSLNTEHLRGMGRYLYDMTACTRPEHGMRWTVLGDDRRQPLLLPPGVDAIADVFDFRGHRFHLWEQLGVPLRAGRHNVDVLHYAENGLALWQPRPSVVTIHDTIPWESDRDSYYLHRLLPAALRRCAAVITISESSRKDILARWPELEPKLTVIPHGIQDEYFADDAAAIHPAMTKALAGRQYLVYMGGSMQRKRFDWALQVLVHCNQTDLHMVACGFGSNSRDVAAASLPDALRGRVHFAPYLSDTELRALYRGAQAVLYPTLYEGFGFPAVEAQASGVPVLFSPLGSLSELIGPLAYTMDADDMPAWVASVERARNLGEARAGMARQARAWARRFQWSASFAQHLAVYKRARQPTLP